MCGIAGVYSNTLNLNDGYKAILHEVGRTIEYRGPDDSGTWLDADTGIGMVHRRLSIQDLSPLGAQPMISASGRYVMVFNGEIYNFKQLRTDLEKKDCVFKGHSDTETILAAFEVYGITASLAMFSGMFAIAVFDRETKKLTLCRDRMGEKPLYYGWVNGHFVFASELKALRAFPFWSSEINRDALTLLQRHNFIPAPHSVYKGIYKLLPSTCITLDLSTKPVNCLPDAEYYWSLENCFMRDGNASPDRGEAADKLDSLLREVISEQMISDVPLGAFLSGGVDSSAVVAIMQQVSSSPVKTFSIGFNEKKYNEAEYARAVAEHLGTEHTELYVTPDDALKVIPALPSMYDEPFADSSQIPTYLVAEMTKRDVTVALSGDGGDELFCGYSRYFSVASAWEKSRQASPGVADRVFAMAAENSPAVLARLIKWVAPSQRHLSAGEIQEKIARRQLLLDADELHDYYRESISYWNFPEKVVCDAIQPPYSMFNRAPPKIGDDICKQMMWQDLNCYLPDDILTKVDRAGMACSLETRIPMLDRRIVEFALGLPIDMNVTAGQGKQVLRDVLYRYVPKHLIEREKAGFAVPVGKWLRMELKDWASDLLDPVKLGAEGMWNVGLVTRKWEDHLAGRGDHEFYLWSILMYQSWYAHQKEAI